MPAIRRDTAAALRRLGGAISSLAERIEASGSPPPGARVAPVAGKGLAKGWDVWLFAAALAVVLASRLVRLSDFPIYFFCDEAVQAVRASEFLRNGFRDEFHQYFPTYFRNGPLFNLSSSVYVQVLPVFLFGTSLFATRAAAALIAVSASIPVALILRQIFAARFWWAAALILGITPAWFLHSRTAFETAMATSFYAWFLYFYPAIPSGASALALPGSAVRRPRFLHI